MRDVGRRCDETSPRLLIVQTESDVGGNDLYSYTDLPTLTSIARIRATQSHKDRPKIVETMDNMDEKLMSFVNLLGLTTFLSIVAYHFVTATPKDADL
jgi:hypothetical protein